MNYEILKMMGLGSFDISYFFISLYILLIVLFVLLIIQMVRMNKLKKRYEKFMTGKSAKSLEKEIANLFDKQDSIKDALVENERDIKKLYKRMEKTLQKVGLVKYDAFNQMGGQLSFCVALLDEKNNGFIINSVHGADGCYSYTKEVKDGKCKIQLGEEEEKALSIAINE